ncbi:hypothetical protein [Modestobacter roseus]|uniref:hypothetical protein n=1 Tax=Modestobacter roseus TaxID=1181884 RepID=UPI00141368A6|nr:hypothetical protein [Modestobacter roseus]
MPDPAPERRVPPRRPLTAVGDVPAGAQGAAGGRPCSSCGHGKVAHEHYRRGSDCALCGCARYSRPLLSRLLPGRR